MAENSAHHFSKTFMPKGRTLRKRCAQIKIQERYLDKQTSLFVQGKTIVEPPTERTFIIPSYECFEEFQSILSVMPFSTSAVETLMLLQTVIRSALETRGKHFEKKCKSLLYDTPSASRTVFLNEITEDTCSDQLEKEIQFSYKIRLFLDACMHLQRSLNCEVIVLICDEKDPLYDKCQCSGIHTETVLSYLETEERTQRTSSSVISNLIITANETLSHFRGESISELNNTNNMSENTQITGQLGQRMRKNIYSSHLPISETAVGISNGSIMKGKFHVFSHNYLEGEVSIPGGQSILISGRKDMNRALDGDEVVIKLHPKEKWRRLSGALSVASQGDNNTGDDIDDADDIDAESSPINPMNSQVEVVVGDVRVPTGMIVAILKRDITEIVVTIPMITFDSTSVSTGESNRTSLEKEMFLLVPPIDRRLPNVRLRTRQWYKLKGHRVIVTFDNWPVDSMFPNGHLTRVIGEANDWKTEVESLLIRHSIFPRPFSAAAIACLPIIPPVTTINTINAETKSNKENSENKINAKSIISSTDISKTEVTSKITEVIAKTTEVTTKITEWKDSNWIMPTDTLTDLLKPVDYSDRRDYRLLRRVFSVDPPGCQDIDDAMSVYWVGPGVIEVAVSIADVCGFLPQGCPLDLEAQTRGTTVYLTHKRMDMLPSLISGDIASLHGGKDRYAVTVTWHIKITHTNGSPVRSDEDPLLLYDNKNIIFDTPSLHSCGRTAIRSVAAMTYSQAHNLIQGKNPDPIPSTVPPGQAGRPVEKYLWEDLRSDLKVLTVFGRFLKGQREINGALDLTQTGGELKFKLNPEGEPLNVNCKEEMEVHNTIAELMIIANSTVARIIDTYKPQETLVRMHAPPAQAIQKEIMKLVLQTGQGIFDGGAPEELRDQLRSFREKMLFPKSKGDKNMRNLKNGGKDGGKDVENGGVKDGGKDENKNEYNDKNDKKTAESIVDLVTSSVIKSMCEALYVCAGSLSGNLFTGASSTENSVAGRLSGHYGLGLACYTHFTSPIRRYADIIVHRQLLAVLESLGGGSGLKTIQLPSLHGMNGNICLDYSDRKLLPIVIPGKEEVFLLSGGNVSSFVDRDIAAGIAPESQVSSIQDVKRLALARSRLYREDAPDAAEDIKTQEAEQGVKLLRIADGRMNYEKVSTVSTFQPVALKNIPFVPAPLVTEENYPTLGPLGPNSDPHSHPNSGPHSGPILSPLMAPNSLVSSIPLAPAADSIDDDNDDDDDDDFLNDLLGAHLIGAAPPAILSPPVIAMAHTRPAAAITTAAVGPTGTVDEEDDDDDDDDFLNDTLGDTDSLTTSPHTPTPPPPATTTTAATKDEDDDDFLNDILDTPAAPAVSYQSTATTTASVATALGDNDDDDDFLDDLLDTSPPLGNETNPTHPTHPTHPTQDLTEPSQNDDWDDLFLESLLNGGGGGVGGVGGVGGIVDDENDIDENEFELSLDNSSNKTEDNHDIQKNIVSSTKKQTPQSTVNTAHSSIANRIVKPTKNGSGISSGIGSGSGSKVHEMQVLTVRAVGDSPYTGDQVTEITAHLNLMNRRSKAVQMECQKMFLRLYFLKRVEEHDAIVYDLRDNGFLAYIPVFDFKGPVYLDKEGVVCLDPILLGLDRGVNGASGAGSGVRDGAGFTGFKDGDHSMDGGLIKNKSDSNKPNGIDNTDNADSSNNTDCARYENRTVELPGYECRLIRDKDDVATELLVCPKGGNGKESSSSSSGVGVGVGVGVGSGSGSGVRGGVGVGSGVGLGVGVGAVLSIKPLQRVRVAITSALFGNNMNSSIRLTLISSTANTIKTISKMPKDEGGSGNRLTGAVMEEKVKPTESSSPSPIDGYKMSNSEKNKESKQNKENKENNKNNMQNIPTVSLYHEIEEAITNAKTPQNKTNQSKQSELIKNCRSKLGAVIRPKRYEIAGRLAFGPEDDIRLIFRSSRNKAIENEKNQERKREIRDLHGVLHGTEKGSEKEGNEGDENKNEKRISEKTIEKMNFKNKDNRDNKDYLKPRIMTQEDKTDLLLESLKDGKTAAMTKMALYGEEWAEEEDLPSSWDAGNGRGADTELGLKASSGGLSKELSLATARQGKLRVAKKNSKY